MIRTAEKNKVKTNGSSNRKKMLEVAKRIRQEKDFKPLSPEEVRKEVRKRRLGKFDE